MHLPIPIHKLRHTLLLFVLAALLTPLALVAYVKSATASYRYTDPARLPAERVAIVFGAGLRPNGRPSRMLADRIQAAADLYHTEQVQKLLMTGDNSRLEYNEVAAMRQYAQELGVPRHDITLDYAGFNTYQSCYRARVIFGVERAILVTQAYHLPRAVYTCRQLGVTATGLGTPDWNRYRQVSMILYTIRETLATVNALWQVHITHPLPRFLGPYEGIA